MNATRTATNRIALAIGNAAAYGFWLTAALVTLGFFALFFSYDTPAFAPIGSSFVAAGSLMVLSILTMVICSRRLQSSSER